MSTQESRIRDYDYSTEGGPPKWVPAVVVFMFFFVVAASALAIMMLW